MTPLSATVRGSNVPGGQTDPGRCGGADEDAGTDHLPTGHEHQPDTDGDDADHGDGAPGVFLDRFPRPPEVAQLLALADRVVLLLRHGPQAGRVDEVDGVLPRGSV